MTQRFYSSAQVDDHHETCPSNGRWPGHRVKFLGRILGKFLSWFVSKLWLPSFVPLISYIDRSYIIHTQKMLDECPRNPGNIQNFVFLKSEQDLCLSWPSKWLTRFCYVRLSRYLHFYQKIIFEEWNYFYFCYILSLCTSGKFWNDHS